MNPTEKSNSINTKNGIDVNKIEDNNLNLSNKDNQTSLDDDRYVFGWVNTQK